MESTFEEVAIAPPRRRRLPAEPLAAAAPTPEAIAARAYELFLERGGAHGADVDDWLRAERELAAPAFETFA